MSKYKGQHGEKRVNKFEQCPPPPFRAMPERNRFFLCEVVPKGVQCTPVPRSGYKIMELDRLDLFLPSSQFAKNLVLPLAGPSFTCHKEHQLDQGIQNSSFCF